MEVFGIDINLFAFVVCFLIGIQQVIAKSVWIACFDFFLSGMNLVMWLNNVYN